MKTFLHFLKNGSNDHFNILAPVYDRLIQLHDRERLIRFLNLPIAGSLLDAGGGTGRIASALRNYVTQVVVADLSYRMLSKAQSKSGLQAICSQSERLPFQENSFDRVVMVDALHHVIDARSTLEELWRVLKPDGLLVIEEPDIRAPAVKIVAILEKLAWMRSRFVSPVQIKSILDKIGGVDSHVHIEGYTSWVIVPKANKAAFESSH